MIGIALGYTIYEVLLKEGHLCDSEILYRIKEKYGIENMLVRRHPGDPYGCQYSPYSHIMDQSHNNSEFILNCETIISHLSSTGMEAILFNRKAITLLPCPAYFASGHDLEGEGLCYGEDFASFFAFCYLIPLEYLMVLTICFGG